MKNFIWMALLLAACSPVYVPNVRNAALFRGAGEVQASGHFGSSLDAQAAVSVTNHIGVMGSFNSVSRKTNDGDDKYLKHKFWEGGIGYYDNAPNKKIAYEVFGGYGRGEGTTYTIYNQLSGPDEIKATGKYKRFFIQPSVGSNNRIFNWIVSARISYVDFENFSYVNDNGDLVIPYNDPVLFVEPAFTGRINFGQSPIYSQFQAGMSIPTQGDPVFDHQFLTLSVGFGLRLGGPKALKEAEN
jgi:hypothetical protein